MTDPHPFLLLVNPHAGAGKAARKLSAIERALHESRANFEMVKTRGPGDATRLVREALCASFSGVAVVGGDGTLNEAVNGFFDESGKALNPGSWLGPLPAGTGGDFRRTLELAKDPAAMVTRMMWARPRPIDVGWLEFKDHDGRAAHRAFLNVASFGLGGLVDELVNAGPKWMGGTGTFLVGTLRAMTRYRKRRVRITVDDGPTRETEIVNMAVANGRFFGGGMQIAPKAEIDDGQLDIVGIESVGIVDQTRLAPHLYRGTLLGRPGVTHARGCRLVAEPADWSGPILLDVDGEALGCLPATFEVLPGALLLKA